SRSRVTTEPVEDGWDRNWTRSCGRRSTATGNPASAPAGLSRNPRIRVAGSAFRKAIHWARLSAWLGFPASVVIDLPRGPYAATDVASSAVSSPPAHRTVAWLVTVRIPFGSTTRLPGSTRTAVVLAGSSEN